MGDSTEVARFIVQNGPDNVLSKVQTARFGRLMTADRFEIEGFRSITNLVEEYLRGSKTQPLSIGVFGRPGSGKSFAVTEVIKEASHMAPIEKVVFNVSQFNQYSDLLSAFQSIRDVSLSGAIPMALFDEFDASFVSTKLGWLRYFLAPMQDGKFSDHGQMHRLGRSIFVFIGGTSPTLEDFVKSSRSLSVQGEHKNNDGKGDLEPQEFHSPHGRKKEDFVAVKGPDFVSRLRGYVNIQGPDKIDDNDRMYSIRRAILLRALLEERMHMSNNHLEVDDSVLSGLLKVPKFVHGSRSLEAILAMSRVSGCRVFERAALPSETQLSLHVDATEFMKLLQETEGLEGNLKEKISDAIGEKLVSLVGQNASDAEKSILDSYDPNSAADDIPHKLRSISCYMAPKPPKSTEPRLSNTQLLASEDGVDGLIRLGVKERDIEELAKLDYERYVTENLNNYQEGRNTTNIIDAPNTWDTRHENTKMIFRKLVSSIPEVLRKCNHWVYRLEEGAPISSNIAPSHSTNLQHLI
ncbi:uncharacterized protein Aud_001679 [Aspergillus udagawae]|uniref:Uncharacterized protein n=1 Tax=Aspergillus udagawae TaxID=91492 RepID=A0A8E0QJB8_9EURO|nr:uncharacterized protein Aud_001679 [Aspergillus udagawae]GIC85839.1 hypothetical protein Aud_001679 [Aspergillus udagawae]